MAHGENAADNGWYKGDLWKPGPLSTYPRTADNKRLERQIKRHYQKQELRKLKNLLNAE